MVQAHKSLVCNRVVQVLDVAKNAGVQGLRISNQEKAPPTEKNR